MRNVHLINMDLNLLLVFDSIYKLRSLTIAGEQLGRTQSAVSHALERLRSVFDDPLFVRTSKQMRPTPKAEELAIPIRNALDTLQKAFSTSDTFYPEKVECVFKISMSDYCETVILPRLMHYLLNKAPKIQIEITSPALAMPQQGLETSMFDLVIGNRDVTAGIFQQKLWVDTFVCMVSNHHPQIKTTMTMDQYLEFPHVLFAPRGKKDRIVQETLKKKGFSRIVALKSPNILVIPEIIKKTPYIITLPRMLATSIDNSQLKLLKPPVNFPNLPIMQYWHEAMHNDPAHCWLRKVIKHFFNNGDE
jgi:DNA-binding transcriptional LysR family regulator